MPTTTPPTTPPVATPSRPVRCVIIPCGRPVSVRQYAAAWRMVRSLPPDTPIRARQWDHCDTTAGRVLRDMRHGLHDRINRHVPRYGIGRRWEPEYAGDVARLARTLRDRCVVRPCDVPRDLVPRLAHRITPVGEG